MGVLAMTVTLPWPPRTLHPNARVHWGKLRAAKASYRHACWALAKHAGITCDPEGKPHVALEFVPPNRHKHDLDGCLSAMKAGLDGLSDAMGCDDSRWTLSLSKSTEIGGFVKVSVWE